MVIVNTSIITYSQIGINIIYVFNCNFIYSLILRSQTLRISLTFAVGTAKIRISPSKIIAIIFTQARFVILCKKSSTYRPHHDHQSEIL